MSTTPFQDAWQLLTLVISIGGGVAAYAGYLLLKLAIRDGINESKLQNETGKTPKAPNGYKWQLVKVEQSTDEELRVY